jgi:hypothetical protein
MITTIRIGTLLRETVTTPYRNLVTRPTGAAVRNRIEEALARSHCHTAYLDFSDVELLDLSCADEIVAKLLMTEVGPVRFVVLAGLREDQHEAIEHVLTHHRLAVAAVPHGPGHPRLLGWVTSDARAAFACIAERGPMRADEVALALDWSVGRAVQALDGLAIHRLVRRDGNLCHPLPIA